MKSPQDEINRNVTEMVESVYSRESDFDQTYDPIKEMLQVLLHEENCSTVTLTNYGAALSDTGQHGAAVHHLRKAIELGADFHQAFFNLGVALMNTQRRKEGAEFIRKASLMEKRDDAILAYFDPMGH